MSKLAGSLKLPDQPDMSLLIQWDAAGFPIGPGEDFSAYCERLKKREEAVQKLDDELAEKQETLVFGEISVTKKDRIPQEILKEASMVTKFLYGFAFEDFPGFFLSENVGLLWGGCLVSDTESPMSVFFIRASFRKKQRFLIYRRQELQAHELCHAARHVFADWSMDEFFAYQTSPSRLRRYLGNCFIHQFDAIFFALPAMMLLGAQILQSFCFPRLSVWPFWIMALAYPVWLLFRNQRGRNEFFRAEKLLRKAGIREAMPVLFRCTQEERKILSEIKPENFHNFMMDKLNELRWKVISARFLSSENKP